MTFKHMSYHFFYLQNINIVSNNKYELIILYCFQKRLLSIIFNYIHILFTHSHTHTHTHVHTNMSTITLTYTHIYTPTNALMYICAYNQSFIYRRICYCIYYIDESSTDYIKYIFKQIGLIINL